MKGSFHAYSCDTKDRYLVHIYLIILSIALAYLIQIICNQMNREIPWWIGLPGIFSIYGTLYYGFKTWLWQWKFFRAIFFIRTPNIQGSYSGIIKSSYDNFKSEKEVDIKILQSWDRIVINQKTESSHSFSQSCSISINDQDIPTISYLYLNEPKFGSIKSMEIHYGMCMLYIGNERLDGDFFTGRGRQTFGTIETEKQNIKQSL